MNQIWSSKSQFNAFNVIVLGDSALMIGKIIDEKLPQVSAALERGEIPKEIQVIPFDRIAYFYQYKLSLSTGIGLLSEGGKTREVELATYRVPNGPIFIDSLVERLGQDWSTVNERVRSSTGVLRFSGILFAIFTCCVVDILYSAYMVSVGELDPTTMGRRAGPMIQLIAFKGPISVFIVGVVAVSFVGFMWYSLLSRHDRPTWRRK